MTKSHFKYLDRGTIHLVSPGDPGETPTVIMIHVESGGVTASDSEVISVGEKVADLEGEFVQVYPHAGYINSQNDLVSVAITGHRPHKLGGYGVNPLSAWVSDELRVALEMTLLEHDRIEVMSGMAQGTDQKAVWEAVALRKLYPGRLIRIAGFLPVPTQADKWPKAAKDHWKHLLDNYVDEVHTTAREYQVWVMSHRNKTMIDRAGLVVAVWDGTDGGTKDAVDQAKRKGLKIWRIDPKTKKSGWYEYAPVAAPKKKKQPAAAIQLELFGGEDVS